jgi:MFS transporter, FSR family, fosmidomycin resistance protein
MKTENGTVVKIATLSVAHLANDWYMNFLQVLLPFLVAEGIGIGRGAFLVSAFTITSSLVQPLFGYWADRKSRGWLIYVGTAWMALVLGLIGLSTNYVVLLAVSAFAGLGTAAFHPQASAAVAALGGTRKGFAQAVFIASGNVGWAFAPLALVPFVQRLGLGATPLLAVPGVLMAVVLRIAMPKIATKPKTAAKGFREAFSGARGRLVTIMLVVAFRSLTYFSLIAFIPLFLRSRGVNLGSSSRFLFVLLFAGAIGGLLGGFLSDAFRERDGRRRVLAASLLLATPFLIAFTAASGFWAYAFAALGGACLLASFSITVILAQEAIEGNAAMASGLMLGFGTGIGGLGVGLLGILAERAGIGAAIHTIVWFPLAAGILALFIGKRRPEPVKPVP